MRMNANRFFQYLRGLSVNLRGGIRLNDAFNEPPLRSELFSADQMEQRGRDLAATHELARERPQDYLMPRLAANEAVLIEVCGRLTAAVRANQQITPASEWLLDNFYLIEEQIRTARRHMPKGYSRELPRLSNGPSAGLPRVYDIALEIISHGDGRVDSESLSRFVAAYQTVSALKLGELWAIPIMLRLALIENLRRVAIRIAADRIDCDLANVWAEKLVTAAETDPKSLVLVIADMAHSKPPMSTPFVAEFARRLQGHGQALALPLTWIEQVLAESGLTIERLVQSENQHQAADQVSISHSIGSLRFLGGMDWREFVENMSVVERTLREDPGGAYSKMDFATRDRYRHVIEKIAKRSSLTEVEIARSAVQLAHEAQVAHPDDGERAAHVGFYLIDRGLQKLETSAQLRFSLVAALVKMGSQRSLGIYLGLIALLTLLFSASLMAIVYTQDVSDKFPLLIGVLTLLPASQLALALVNWLTTIFVRPHPLPRMDFSAGMPAQSRTLVVVPTMLSNPQSVDDLIEALEVRFLANQDDNLYFGLLTDFRDAHEEVLAEDEPLLQLAQDRIKTLNTKYGTADKSIFFLFHRPRRWNPQEHIWMGYERKRGKLADLNALLRNGMYSNADKRFSCIVGDTSCLANVKYAITLDTDTQLPRDVARQLVAAMAHPLNRPRYDEQLQRVQEGYGILQPRVSVSLEGNNRSRYAHLHGGETGIDPYTRAISDVYQDMFGEGSFIGKGIYEVDTFERTLNGRFPENRILSHDLLEGCYARAGLLSDVHVYEDYPAHYSMDVSRRHRWIRGDWQLLGWLFPRVPGPGKQRLKNALSNLSRWKLFDNLRRSLVPTAMLLLLLLGWAVLASPWIWTLALISTILIPPLIISVVEIFRKPSEVRLRQHLAVVLDTVSQRLVQAVFTLACLPFEAWFSLDAIVRTAWRMLFTQRRLLEWNPSGEAKRTSRTDFTATLRMMWVAPTIAIAAILYLLLFKSTALVVAGPILLLWLCSPAIVWWMNRPFARRAAQLTAEQTIFLRKLSRKTWAFFETFVGPEDHWLPPDNYQEYRGAAVAHRTSPTNIGVALLANLSAYDFGYIPAGQFIERTANTFDTMQTLERYRGHFYNWYDTKSLKLLHPAYVSTVDSGNLAGHLLTLRSGLLTLADDKILDLRWFHGLQDTLGILVDATGSTKSALLAALQAETESACGSPPATLALAWRHLNQLTEHAEKFAEKIEAASPKVHQSDSTVVSAGEKWRAETGGYLDADTDSTHHPALDHASAVISEITSESDAVWWAHTFVRQCRAVLDELTFLAPWLALPAAPNGLLDDNLSNDAIPTLRELANIEGKWLAAIEQRLGVSFAKDAASVECEWLHEFRRCIMQASRRATERIAIVERLARQSSEFASMAYDFLYDKSSRLLAIGYNVDELRRDTSYYDLLASEARLINFVAIAQGQVPQESWFALGRLLTSTGSEPVLLSWSGSMFEYLMPLLVMPTFHNTLLDQTYKAAVARQIEYGKQRSIPWGMSESGYNLVDAHLNYQYRAFGVPGLGLKRGLADDLVVAPYATVLALMVSPEAACLNLQQLAAEGLEGKFGFYEAIDYTPSRQRRGESSTVVRSYMAHHQGMSLLSLAYLLLDRPMQKRFESEPLFQATLLLLQERIPRTATFFPRIAQFSDIQLTARAAQAPIRVFNSARTPIPEVQLLSNGRYHVMVTNAGGGYSRWKDLAVTRWREDTTRDHWGAFCYIRDENSGEIWSTAYQPTLKQPKHYEVTFSEGRAEFRRRDLIGDGSFETYTEIVVSPEDDIELRRIRITNRTGTRRAISVTSYAEVVLAVPAADALHPAFSNLFVQTEIDEKRQAILCTRRPRSATEQTPWMFHMMTAHGEVIESISYETDRMQFIGRGHTVTNPQALNNESSDMLSGGQGSVLDPIVAIRLAMTLDPEQTITLDMVSGMGETRDGALSLVERYQDRRLADRVFDVAWTHAQVVLRQLNASEADAQLYGRLANSIVYANDSLRAETSILMQNRRGQSGLWSYAISGDLPIVLLHIGDATNIELVRQLVQAHAYWRLKGLAVDLVIWNEDRAGYRQLLQDQIIGLIAAGTEAHVIDRPGGIFVRRAEQISNEDRILFQSVARAIITDSRGTLAEQINRRILRDARMPRIRPNKGRHADSPGSNALPQRDLILHNGLGGFTPDGREYVIATTATQVTPAPWVNVLANAHFGTVISENGQAYTWSENAHEFRLTPWHNDPVSDGSGEAFYLRDEESGYFWSPTPLPCRGANPYVSRHGFGYSVFEHTEGGIVSELWVYVAIDAAVKFSVLKVRNASGRPRRLSATGYVEWVLGDLQPKSTMHVTTEVDAGSGALFAHNPYNTEFTGRIAFFDVDETNRSISCDRSEFIGRNGSLNNPAAMAHTRLSGKTGAGLDPCAAIQVGFDLADGQEREIIFRLGQAGRRGADDARNLVRRFRGPAAARTALEAVWQYWNHTLGAVQVETPDSSLNVLANGWLIYQTLACRLWARSGYYQSGGAFGFRDQLQDVMALIHAEPQRVRDQLLLCAAHQFVEGDVQHWWHPPSSRGVRTRCSDDYLWLPLAVSRYVLCTGDTGVLDESIPFLEGRPVGSEDDSYYDLPEHSGESASLYQHCIRAIRHGLRFGDHGLPLIGSGDWNDGMNLVGIHGKGESVWLGFFLYEVLKCFAELAQRQGDVAFAEQCRSEAEQLRQRIEQTAWDGEWYRRAYFDDGTALGTVTNIECQIDSISQSWSVLSGAGDITRSRRGMDAVYARLVRHDHALIQLLDPPFDKSDLDPGYIKGYVPGVRENGGQYTHAAIWTVMAFAALGESQRAWELLTMINPVNHGKSAAGVATYKAEPYVVAADVYAVSPHAGRGGWSWYTGSAGWMYRLIVESLLGLRLDVDKLHFTPCLPTSWQAFKLHYRYRETVYHIVVSQMDASDAAQSGVMRVTLDGVDCPDKTIQLIDDRQDHSAEVSVAIPFNRIDDQDKREQALRSRE
ncbi:GH36-type glycosyl hydrolase domain-containing protein [Nitrosomonas halophila]|uniref:Cellobiose phosphorylase n=1 Tax=Nitrosomonas halophila TaxID=44576 RepID=A0A1H3JU42_9PROT|nr:glucoamylase family protein [Nitrosomonas halophila]SDY42784.1 Cellobiose phosphorylase [Nitrosomonas halophila]